MEPEPILAKSIREISAEVAALREAGIDSLTDSLAQWLASQYFIAAREAARQSAGAPIPLDTLRSLTAQIVSLRREDHYARQLDIQAAQLDLNRQFTQEHLGKLFPDWIKLPENQDLIRKFAPKARGTLSEAALLRMAEQIRML